jgi:tripartite-type tricarboxylate transporter receptor subunit TctC
VVNSQLPVKNVEELLALARSKPGGLSYASAGNATTSHLTMELFQRRTDVRLVHIPYKGEAPALNDLMGGQVDVAFSSLASVLPHLQSGRLRVLGVTSAQRAEQAPQLPTLSEAAVPGFQSVGWYALLAPQGTPRDAVARLHKEVQAILAEPESRARMAGHTLTPASGTPDALRTWISSDMERWRKVIAEAGIKAE